MTIKAKIILSAILTIILFFTIVLYSWFGNRAMIGTLATARAFEQELMYIQMLFRGVNESLLTEGTQDSIELAMEGFNGFERTHKGLMSQDIKSDLKIALSKKIDPQWLSIKDDVAQFMVLNDVHASNYETMEGYGRLLLLGEMLSLEIKSLAARSQVMAESTGKTLRFIFNIVVILILMIMSMLFLNLYNSIIRPINILKNATRLLAKGNLGERVEIKTHDEIGQLSESFNKMGSVLNETTVSRDSLIEQVEMRKKSEKRAEHMAYHDQLTGLPNRHLLIDRLAQTIAQKQRDNKLAAVIFIDLDNFKLVNDSLGHAAGDILIKSTAERLKKGVRASDTLARHGGDEFTVLIHDMSKVEYITNIVEMFFSAFETPFNIEGQNFFITISVGISVYPTDGSDADTLLKNADTAMYRAKASGKNSYQLFRSDMNDRAIERLNLEYRLRKAIKNEEFLLYFQPQIDTTTGEVSGVESLVRWKDPHNGIIPPGQFIPMAEDTGLIIPIGNWVMRTACAQNKLWQDNGMKPFTIAVNISMRQFKQKDFISTVTTILQETNLEPQYLELELTETIVMEDMNATLKILHSLKSLGIRLSIDDFGTGYSSLAYLKEMPINMLKIAQEFVRDINVDQNDVAIAKATIQMAQSMGLEVIAEGVETIEHQRVLTALNCKKTQGYLFSKPLPADEFEVFIENHQAVNHIYCA